MSIPYNATIKDLRDHAMRVQRELFRERAYVFNNGGFVPAILDAEISALYGVLGTLENLSKKGA